MNETNEPIAETTPREVETPTTEVVTTPAVVETLPTANSTENIPVDPMQGSKAQIASSPPLSIGRIVHYVERHSGKHQPAICTEAYSGSKGNLAVFTDVHDGGDAVKRMTAVYLGDAAMDGSYPPHTWHWPERT